MSVSERDTGTSQVIRRGDNPATPAVPPANGSRAVSASAEIGAVGGASRSADRPPALQGQRIPSRNGTVRRYVVTLYEACSWLTVADLPAATRWAHLFDRFRRRAEILDKLPVVKVTSDDAEPRKLDAEQRATSTAMDRIEAALGITATARAALGVDITRMRKLAGDDGGDGEDVAALESRIIEGLQQGGGGSSPPVVPASPEDHDD